MTVAAIVRPEWDRAGDETNTAPSESVPVERPVPTVAPFRQEAEPTLEASVSPKPQDVTKLVLPLPYTITLLVLALGGAAGIWRIEDRVNIITTTIEYERELDRRREKELDQRFAALEAKIEAAGLRNAALAMSQQLSRKE